jgi:hypothetical protein
MEVIIMHNDFILTNLRASVITSMRKIMKERIVREGWSKIQHEHHPDNTLQKSDYAWKLYHFVKSVHEEMLNEKNG